MNFANMCGMVIVSEVTLASKYVLIFSSLGDEVTLISLGVSDFLPDSNCVCDGSWNSDIFVIEDINVFLSCSASCDIITHD